MSTTLASPERADSPVTGALQQPNPEPGHQEVKAWLLRAGATRLGHAHARSLCEHLLSTRQILARWSLPVWIQNAGALHSVYSTDVYKRQLIPLSERSSVRSFIGSRAQRAVFLFCTLPRQGLFSALERRGDSEDTAEDLVVKSNAGNAQERLSQEDVDALLLVHMANEAEQAQAADSSPGMWLERVSRMAGYVSASVSLPPFLKSGNRRLSREQEEHARASYLGGLKALQAGDLEESSRQFALSSGDCPVWAEPTIWRAYLALQEADFASALQLTAEAKRQISSVGVAWDKRLTFREWMWLACALERLARGESARAFSAQHGRRFASLTARFELGEITTSGLPTHVVAASSAQDTAQTTAAQDASSSSLLDKRFQQYMSSFADNSANPRMFHYPSLPSQPFFQSDTFPIVVDLEANFAQIRDEVSALDETAFHPESEKSIRRSGMWKVFMLYERGRKQTKNCELCPTVTRIIERHDTLRTLAGLMYVSRMNPHTDIQAHRGPTNMRLRCHLGIQVPDGDCVIKVGGQVRRWEESKCLVFDDYYQHEAWNHTDQLRTVLILDIWHPGLSRSEVQLLEGLHRYVMAQTQSLNNYWNSNEKARKQNYD
jgi:aspartyl/asparaginyl beta-hydroxylase (cupin superfamily)